MKISKLVGDLSYEEIKKRKWKIPVYYRKTGKMLRFMDYLISNDGIIIRKTSNYSGGTTYPGKKIKVIVHKQKYKTVRLYINKVNSGILYMYRLMWGTWKGRIKKGYEINHTDWNKSNFSDFSKLECTTPSENVKHTYRGGMNHGRSKFKKDDLIEMFRLFNERKLTMQRISEIYKVNVSVISRILNRKTYKNLSLGGKSDE